MYGTIARFRVKPGMEAQMLEFDALMRRINPPGMVGVFVYRMDADPREFFEVAIFDSRESYRALAESPEQDARYQQFAALLEGPPEWHDGEVVASSEIVRP